MRERNAIKIIDKNRRQESDINNLRKRVAELEAAQRWVSADERVPEHENLVVIIAYDELDIASYENGKWFPSDSLAIVDGVTHWMELPALPEVEP